MSEPPRHPQLVVRTTSPGDELAELRLFELGATGIERRDRTTLDAPADEAAIVLIASFPDPAAARAALEALGQGFDVKLDYVVDQDWAIEWRRGFGSQAIGARLFLQPSWEASPCPAGRVLVTIDPENAFGSGDHETTRLVLGVLDRVVEGTEHILDVGCGSGVLSIAALRLGAERATGIDIDSDATAAARRNAALNGVEDRFDAWTTTLAEMGTQERYDIVVANIEAGVLASIADTLLARLRVGGLLVLSGVLESQCSSLLEAFRGAELRETQRENEWCALVLGDRRE